MTVLVMGVSGSGKSTFGAALAARLGVPFVDADALHPPVNIERMSAGLPLGDADRAPWLERVGEQLARTGGVVACSALKRSYRDRLRDAAPSLALVYLRGDARMLEQRALARTGHFMPPSLLASQLAALEPPGPDENPLVIDVAESTRRQLDRAVDLLDRAVDLLDRSPLARRPLAHRIGRQH